jgi:hypothetical protein
MHRVTGDIRRADRIAGCGGCHDNLLGSFQVMEKTARRGAKFRALYNREGMKAPAQAKARPFGRASRIQQTDRLVDVHQPIGAATKHDDGRDGPQDEDRHGSLPWFNHARSPRPWKPRSRMFS